MKFAQEHQNPFVVGSITGGTVYPEDHASLLQVDNPNVLLWTLKPHDDGMGKGLVARVWNLSTRPQSYTISTVRPMTEARRITHIETDDATLTAPIMKDGKMTATAHGYEMQTHRMVLSGKQ
jgi:alpha-mannosidase